MDTNFNYKRKPKNDIERAMEMKESSIKGFQSSKEQSINLTSSARDATLMVTTLIAAYPDMFKESSEEDIKNTIKSWRAWFYDNVYNIPF